MFKNFKALQAELKKAQNNFSKLTKEKKEQILTEISKAQNNLKISRQKFYEDLKGRRVKIDVKLRKAHQKLKVSLLRYFFNAKIRHFLSAPIIYSVIIPLIFLDLFLEIYHHTCFYLYRIQKVKRSDYILIDRQKLAYLNLMQKINCVYCGYGNGLISYAKEIIARTEKYWCPIKHSKELPDPHNYYEDFFEYSDGEGYVNRKKAK